MKGRNLKILNDIQAYNKDLKDVKKELLLLAGLWKKRIFGCHSYKLMLSKENFIYNVTGLLLYVFSSHNYCWDTYRKSQVS